jgi:hypothetical protein
VKNKLSNEWWIGELHGVVKKFPLNYVRILPEEYQSDLQFKISMKKISPAIAKLQSKCGFFEEKTEKTQEKREQISLHITALQSQLASTIERAMRAQQTGTTSALSLCLLLSVALSLRRSLG